MALALLAAFALPALLAPAAAAQPPRSELGPLDQYLEPLPPAPPSSGFRSGSRGTGSDEARDGGAAGRRAPDGGALPGGDSPGGGTPIGSAPGGALEETLSNPEPGGVAGSISFSLGEGVGAVLDGDDSLPLIAKLALLAGAAAAAVGVVVGALRLYRRSAT